MMRPRGRHWIHSYWLWLAVPGAVAFEAYVNRRALGTALGLLPRASLPWLGAAILAIAAVYLCRATMYGVPLRLLGFRLPLPFLWATALVATSIHQVIPAAGASGYAFLVYALHARGVPAGQAPLIALVDTLSNAVAVGILVVVSLVYLGAAGDLHLDLVLLLLGAPLIALAAYVYRLQRDRARFTALVLRLVHRVASFLGRRWPAEPVREFLDAYYGGKKTIAAHPRAFYRMVALQYLALVGDVAALYMVFRALGVSLEPRVAFMAFVAAVAGLSVVSLPGGGGSFEVVMSGFLSSHGIATADAIAGTLLYRIVAFWLPVLGSALLLRGFRRAHRERQAGRPPKAA